MWWNFQQLCQYNLFSSQVNNFTLFMSLGQRLKSGLEYMNRNNVDFWTDPTRFHVSCRPNRRDTHTDTATQWVWFSLPAQKRTAHISVSKKKQVNQKGMFIDLLSPSMFFVLLVFAFKLKSLFFFFVSRFSGEIWILEYCFHYCFGTVFKTVRFLPLF